MHGSREQFAHRAPRTPYASATPPLQPITAPHLRHAPLPLRPGLGALHPVAVFPVRAPAQRSRNGPHDVERLAVRRQQLLRAAGTSQHQTPGKPGVAGSVRVGVAERALYRLAFSALLHVVQSKDGSYTMPGNLPEIAHRIALECKACVSVPTPGGAQTTRVLTV